MRVGFVGLGNMGAAIARNLIKAGHTLTVYNRTRSRAEEFRSSGARIAKTPAEAASNRLQACVAPVRAVCLIAFLVFINGTPTWTAAQTQQIDSLQKPAASRNPAFNLPPETDQVADQIGVATLLERLGRLSDGSSAGGSSMSLESLTVRQEITERILRSSLDIDGVNAVIDSEIEQIRSIRSDLQSKRDKAQNVVNIASIVTGGAFGAIASALQFKASTVNLGNGIGVAGGAGSALLSIVGIRKQGGRRSLGDSPRMLARFFGREPGEPEVISSEYPKEVWSYLNSVSPSQPDAGTPREQLIAKWRSEGRIEPDGTPKGKRKIESLSGNIAVAQKLDIEELNDRMAMLHDVRARVSLMKRQLSEILKRLTPSNGNQ